MGLLENETYRASLERMCESVDLSFLAGRTIVVTGARGMLGSCLIDSLILWDRTAGTPCRIVALSRDRKAAEERFGDYWDDAAFSYLDRDVCGPMEGLPEQVDYIVHAASNADPVRMAEHPVETLLANVRGTANLLDYGLGHGMRRFLYVSSGEVYGSPDSAMSDFTEGHCGALDLSSPRSCYPEGKRAAEVLCQSYISQHRADAVIVRPCHLFGPTLTDADSRAAAQFMRQAAAGDDILLKSPGQLNRSHCYVVDAVKALLFVLRSGVCGEAYNIADRRYQMTVRELAEAAARAGGCRVAFAQPSDAEVKGYTRARHMVLDPSRLEVAGWSPDDHSRSAVEETVNILKELRKGR